MRALEFRADMMGTVRALAEHETRPATLEHSCGPAVAPFSFDEAAGGLAFAGFL